MVCNWVKHALANVGIQANPQSTRAIATSMALALGAPLDDILRVASWKNASTFAQFYYHTVPIKKSAKTKTDNVINSVVKNQHKEKSQRPQ